MAMESLVKVTIGSAGICFIIAAVFFGIGKSATGGLFMAVGFVIVVLSFLLGSRG